MCSSEAPATGRIRLDLAYLGTRFEGWQIQETMRGGEVPRTVQGVLEAVLSKLYGAPLRVTGASRTDAGVHAEGQIAHFDEPAGGPRIPPPGLLSGLNSLLPEDLRVTSVARAPVGWNARFSACGKVYRYRLRLGLFLHPHRGLIEALVKEPLDVDAMRRAARLLVGTRDFRPFSIAGSEPRTTVTTLTRLEVNEEEGLLLITAEGDRFLRGMVRRLVGTLREAGRGRISPEEAPERPGPTAEARGLTLERVLYPPERPGGSSSNFPRATGNLGGRSRV